MASVVTKVVESLNGLHPAVTKILGMTKPTFVNGRWRKPKLSRRRIAEVGKKMLQYPGGELAREALQYWTQNNKSRLPQLTPETLGNFKKDPIPRRIPKGNVHERQRENREKKIADNMAKMPKMIENWRKAKHLEHRKERKGFELFWQQPKKKV